MGMMVLAFTAFATPNPMTAPVNNLAFNAENSFNGLAVSSSKVDVSSETNGRLNSLIATTSLVAHSTNSNNALADVTFSVSSPTADVGDQVCVDFSVTGFTDIVSIQYSMNWDATKLDYVASQNYNLTDLNAAAFGTAGTSNGDLTLSWFHNATTGVTLPDGAVIYQVCFDVLADAEGQSVAVGLSGTPTSIEVTDNTFAVQNFINEDGAVIVSGTPPPPPASGITFNVSSSTADAGTQTCLDVSVDGFTDIVSFQYSMNWDENILGYASVQNFNLTDLNAAAFGTSGTANGDLTASWIHQATTGVTVPDGTVIYQVCFDVLAGTEGETAAVSLSGAPTSIEVTNNTNAVVDFSNNNGQVSVNGTPPPPSSGVTFNVSSSTVDAGDETCLNVSVEGFTNIVSFQYSMNWDENILGYSTVQSFNLTDLNAAAFGTSGTANGDLTASWIHQATTGVTVPDGTVIYKVCFDALAGTEGQTAAVSLSGSPTSIEVTDTTSGVVDFSNNNGQVSVNGTPPPPSSGVTFNVSSSTVDAGDETCLNVSVEGFTNIVSFQYSMNWDENILGYSTVQSFNLTDLNAAAFGTSGTANGDLTASWIHQATTGVTVPDGTVIYQVCFDALSGTDGQTATIGLSGSPTSIEVTDNTSSVVDFSNNAGQVSVNDNGGGQNSSDLSFIVEEVTGENGEQVCMDISVEGFNDIVSAQYSMNWDASVLTFASVQNYNLTDLNAAAFGTSGTAAGNLTLSWIHQATTGVTVPDGTVIYQVCFDVNGTDGETVGVSISGSPTSIEVTDNTSSVITPIIDNGQVTVQGDNGGGTGNGNLTFTVEDVEGEEGEMICLDVTVDNFTDVVSAQYSMNWDPTELQFNGVQNYNLTDLNEAAFGTNGTDNGDLTMSWIHQATTGVTVPDGTVIYQVCFTVLSGVGSTPLVSFSGAPTSIEITDNTSSVIPFFSNPGQVTIVTGSGGGNDDLEFTMQTAVVEIGESFCLDVTVDNFNAIVSAQYSINWDPTVLSFTGVQGFNLTDLNASSFGTTGTANGNLTSSWFHQATTGITLPTGTVIYQVCFEALTTTGSTNISFSGSPTSIETTTINNQIVPFTSVPGVVIIEGSDTNGPTQDNANLTFTIESETAETGDNICLDISVDDFVDIVSFQYSMVWDESILDFTGLQAFNLEDLNEPDFGQGSIDDGILTVSWIHEATTGVTVPNGTVIYQACFDVIGASGSISQVAIGGTPTSIEVTSNTSNGQDIDAEFNAGNVSVEGEVVTEDVVFQYECVDGEPGDIVCIPVSTQNFTNISSFQYSMHWNDDILSYQSVQAFGIPFLAQASFGEGNAANGSLGVVWTNDEGLGTSVPNGDVLFEICFEIIGDVGQSTLMTFDGFPTAVEVTDVSAAELPVTFLQCAVNVVNNCPAATITQNSISNVSCQGGNNGLIEVTVSGGDDAYTYQWIDNSSNGILSLSEDIGGLPAGNYTLNVTTCGGAETASQTFQVTEPNTSISISETVGTVTCFEGQDGTISVTGQGGTGSLTYNWTGGNLPANTTGTNLSGLMASTYSLTVTDANQCTMNEAFTVEQPASQLSLDATVTDVSCNGNTDGAIAITATGGWGNYSYAWTGGLSGTNPQNLAAGMYTVTVEDQEGCEMVDELEVNQPANVVIAGTTTDVATDSPGAINITPGGGSGTGTYTYQWTGPDNYSAITEDLNNLSIGGQYCVTVTDANNCTDTQCFTINSPLIVEIDEVQFSCADESNGFINISTFGGQGTITYSWTGPGPYISDDEDINGLAGGTYIVLVTDGNGSFDTATVELTEAASAISVSPVVSQLSDDGVCDGVINVSGATGGFGGYTFLWNTVDAATTSTVTNLCAGDYTVTITDSEGCSTTSTTTIEYIPVELVADATTTSTSCFGECNGSVTVDILTGVAPYTIEIKDAAGITIASGTDLGNDGTETFGNLCAQSVLVLITDDAGQTMEIPSQVIDEPAPLTIVSSTIFPVTIAAGNNGAISVNVEGGTGEYEYDWSPGSNDQTNVNLSVGAYSVEVTDENGCSMTSEIFQLQLFEVSALDIDDADCVGDTNGEACATVAGGNGDYTYLWSSGEMTNCISEKEAGNYTVTITDVVSGVSISQEVNIETQSFLTATAAPSTLFVGGANVSCAGRSDGAATANSQGGMNDVSYVWNDSNNTNSQAISNVPAGVYTVTATDEIGCISTASVTITEPEPFSTTLEIDGISCNGQRDGAITAVPTGGANTDVAEYDYEWTGTGIVNAFLPTVSNLTEGLYTVNITDPNGCETTGTTELFEPEILEVTAVTTADDGSQNGTATAIVTGGTEDYSYEWRSNGEVGTTEELTGLAAGSYMLFVTDANGCEAMEMDIIVQDNSLGCLDTRLVITPFSSPGENDEFVINCIENYEENRLEIYNRWGQLVYTQENYDCGTDDCPNGWKGTNLRDAELAGGGYFYVLEYEEQGVTKQLKGSITILKE
jgi:gliding motility-associated-like protein